MKRFVLLTLVLLLSVVVGCGDKTEAMSEDSEENVSENVSQVGKLDPKPRTLDSLRPVVSYPVRQGELASLEAMADFQFESPRQGREKKIYRPARLLQDRTKNKGSKDELRQIQKGAARAPSLTVNFEGVSNADNVAAVGFGVYPPDTVGDVGPNHYVQWVNLSLAIYDKAGNRLFGPVPGNSLWAGFGGLCESNNNGDVLVVYDQLADRWVFSQFALGADGHQCFAVSKTSDPLGAYHLYDFVVAPGKLNDYPKLGVWPDGYYLTFNEFAAVGGTYKFSSAVGMVFNRQAMLAGLNAAQVRFDIKDNTQQETYFAVQPSHLEGMVAPPAGAPNTLVMSYDDESFSATGTANPESDFYKVWAMHADWSDPGASTLTGPVTLATSEFAVPGKIPQSGTTSKLDSLGGFTMYRLVYRNMGTHESLVINHTVQTGGQAGIRWAELRNPSAPVVYQAGTYAPADGAHRWMGSVAMDALGNIALGYSVSSDTLYPSIRFTGRLASDPLGVMTQGEGEIIAGGGSQTGGDRWGDYSALSVEEDGCTFWYTTEYYAESSSSGWQTRVASFSFPNCTATATGSLEGKITSALGAPIEGAVVRVGVLSTQTDNSGNYKILIPVGTFDVNVSAFGFVGATAVDVEIQENLTTALDFALEPSTFVQIEGFVYDGSQAGWPLYAKVVFSAPNMPDLDVYSDPLTGYYRLDVINGVDYTVSVSSLVPGYQMENRPVTPGLSDMLINFALEINTGTCNAPGYSLHELTVYLEEDFEGASFPPAGWEVNNQGDCPWTGVSARSNLTGGSGKFAIGDSDTCGRGTLMNTELVSEVFDLTDLDSALKITFNNDFYAINGSVGTLEIFNGTDWVAVDTQTTHARGPMLRELGTTAANKTPVARLRFRYQTSGWHWWWQLDNVRVVGVACEYEPGGLLYGNVYDENTALAMNGAQVGLAGGATVTTLATPEDPNVDDGFYSLFLPGTRDVTVENQRYQSQAMEIIPQINGASWVNFKLAAGRLVADPTELEVRAGISQTALAELSLINQGTYQAGFSLIALDAAPMMRPNGPFAAHGRRTSPKRIHERNATYIRVPFDFPEVPILRAGNVVKRFNTGLAGPWGVGYNTGLDDLWVGDVVAAGGQNRLVQFEPDGTASGSTVDISSYGSIFAADLAYNVRTGMLWQVNVGGDNCIHEVDPVGMEVTGKTICPAFGTSERGLAYDPVTDTYFAGSWNDGVIKQFDSEGKILRSVNVGLDISGLAYQPASGHLFALTNSKPPQLDVYVLDANEDFSVIGAFELYDRGVPVFANHSQAGLELDCQGNLWAVNQKTKEVIVAESGESSACLVNPAWLSIDPANGTVLGDAQVGIDLSFDSAGMTPGLRQLQLLVITDTPYAVPSVPFYFTVAFNDVDSTHWADDYIHALAGARVTMGCGAGNFCPEKGITRAQMVVWILKAMLGYDYVPAPATGLVFDDVSPESFAAAWIEDFARRGLSTGCGGRNFCPLQVVSRKNAPVLILKSLLGVGYVPPAPSGLFDDVPDDPFRPWIEDFYRRGLSDGCGVNLYCPEDPTTRAQAATSIVRAFEIPVHLQ
jgi:hypothetical protein